MSAATSTEASGSKTTHGAENDHNVRTTRGSVRQRGHGKEERRREERKAERKRSIDRPRAAGGATSIRGRLLFRFGGASDLMYFVLGSTSIPPPPPMGMDGPYSVCRKCRSPSPCNLHVGRNRGPGLVVPSLNSKQGSPGTPARMAMTEGAAANSSYNLCAPSFHGGLAVVARQESAVAWEREWMGAPVIRVEQRRYGAPTEHTL